MSKFGRILTHVQSAECLFSPCMPHARENKRRAAPGSAAAASAENASVICIN